MVKVHVKQEHIDKGWRISSHNCPLALAVRDLIKEDLFISVGLSTVSIGTSFLSPDYSRSEHGCGDKIRKYDYDKSMDPFEFELDIPPHFLKEVENG